LDEAHFELNLTFPTDFQHGYGSNFRQLREDFTCLLIIPKFEFALVGKSYQSCHIFDAGQISSVIMFSEKELSDVISNKLACVPSKNASL
jgi:hypothetical protein